MKTNYDFDQRIVKDVPVESGDFRRYYSPEDVQLFTMFEIVNSREESLFEFNLASSKEYNKIQKKKEETRSERVARLEAFYAANAAAELSPFEDCENVDVESIS